jgi:hypothetical protein
VFAPQAAADLAIRGNVPSHYFPEQGRLGTRRFVKTGWRDANVNAGGGQRYGKPQSDFAYASDTMARLSRRFAFIRQHGSDGFN